MANPRSAGQPMIDFRLPATDGSMRDSAEARRRGPLLLVFWKRTCSVCRYTFPFIERLHSFYGPRGLQVWGIAQESAGDAAVFANETGVTFPQLLDASLEVTEQYDLAAVPAVYLAESSGQLLHGSAGFSRDGLNDIATEVARLLRAPDHPAVQEEDAAPARKPG